MSVTLNRARHPKLKRTLRSIARNWDLYLLLVPVLAYFIIFHYAPMYGVQIAFRRYSIRKGILGSQWVGMAHFNRFFQSYYFERLLVNTLTISLYNLALGFPLPILLALLLNEVTSQRYKKLVQTITYAPALSLRRGTGQHHQRHVLHLHGHHQQPDRALRRRKGGLHH